MPTPADRTHRVFQQRLAILRAEKENTGELYPSLGYELSVLEAWDANYDDLADMENMKIALRSLLKIFEYVEI